MNDAQTDNQLVNWLVEDESRSRPFRARRLRLLVDQYGRPDIRVFSGGMISAIAFEESRQAYLHGLFVAAP